MTLAEKLVQAENALHALRIGKAKTTVNYGDRRVTYVAADRAELERYIAELKSAIANGGVSQRGAPFPVQFS